MDFLTFSQIFYNFVASTAIIIVGVLLAFSLYYFLKTTKNVSEISEKLNSATDEVKSKISGLLDKLSGLPFLSFFADKLNKRRESRKGRKQD